MMMQEQLRKGDVEDIQGTVFWRTWITLGGVQNLNEYNKFDYANRPDIYLDFTNITSMASSSPPTKTTLIFDGMEIGSLRNPP